MNQNRVRRAIQQLFGGWRLKATTGLRYGVLAVIAIDALMLLLYIQGASTSNVTALLIVLFGTHFALVFLALGAVRHSIEEGQENFRKIFHVSPVAMTITSLEDGRLIDANNAYWKLTGYDPKTSTGRSTIELGIGEDHSERSKFISKLKEQKSLHNPAYEFKNQLGETCVTVALYELVVLNNQPAILSMYYDVTEQRSAQLALQASEQRYRNFVEQSIEGIWLLAFDKPIPINLPAEEQTDLIYKYGYISECNDVLARMYGYSSSTEMHGVRLLDMYAAGTPNETSYLSTLQLVKDGYRSANWQTVKRKRTGDTVFFLNNAIGIIRNDHLVGLWGTQLDVTALKTA